MIAPLAMYDLIAFGAEPGDYLGGVPVGPTRTCPAAIGAVAVPGVLAIAAVVALSGLAVAWRSCLAGPERFREIVAEPAAPPGILLRLGMVCFFLAGVLLIGGQALCGADLLR